MLLLTGWTLAIMSLLLDVVLDNSWSLFWVVIYFASFGGVVILAWLFRTQVLNRFNIDSVALNLSIAGLLGALKNLTVAVLAPELGLVVEPLWAFRVVGGFVMGVAIFAFSGTALGARVEHTAMMAQLTQVQNTLLALRTSSKARLAEANEALALSTRDLLLPKLEAILALVRDRSATVLAIDGLRELIQKDVRPLSSYLGSTALKLSDEPVTLQELPSSFKMLHPRVELHGLIKPNSAGLSTVLFSWLLAYTIMGAPACNVVFYLGFVSWGIAWLSKLIIPRGLNVARGVAIWILLLVGTVMAVPVVGAGLSQVDGPIARWLVLLMWPITLASFLAFALSESLDRDRVAARDVLEAENQSLAHDQALFEQQLWLGRRAWQFVVHGSVQSALTAALTRLQSSPEPEQYMLNLVVEDLERARLALTATPSRKIDLPEAMRQLQATWRGICDIRTEISERGSRVLQKNNDACICVNEIIKEAVSNAVRHGEAKSATILIDRHDAFSLEITVSNDGLPLRDQQPLGVGSRLIEELTTDWSLESNKATGLTVFKANLPLQSVWN
jgi:two-component sensor histidine kinase